jgi:hypothetical protein
VRRYRRHSIYVLPLSEEHFRILQPLVTPSSFGCNAPCAIKVEMPSTWSEGLATNSSGLLSRNLLGAAGNTAADLFWEKFLLLNRLRDLYQKVRQPDRGPILENLLEELQITYDVASEDLAGIPTTGPTIVVANHPFGMLEGAILGSMLPRIRRDVKIMTNYLLAGLPEIEDQCIFVDPFNGTRSLTA